MHELASLLPSPNYLGAPASGWFCPAVARRGGGIILMR
jgi:hypothetical protein